MLSLIRAADRYHAAFNIFFSMKTGTISRVAESEGLAKQRVSRAAVRAGESSEQLAQPHRYPVERTGSKNH